LALALRHVFSISQKLSGIPHDTFHYPKVENHCVLKVLNEKSNNNSSLPFFHFVVFMQKKVFNYLTLKLFCNAQHPLTFLFIKGQFHQRFNPGSFGQKNHAFFVKIMIG
jgi:hypothetical protein